MKTRKRKLEGHTRWARAAVGIVPAMVAVAALAFAMLQGAIATNVAISASGVEMQIARVEGGSTSAFVSELQGANGEHRPTLFAAISGGEASGGTCAVIPVDLPVLGMVTVKATISNPIQLEDVVADADLLQVDGEGVIKNAEVGLSADTLKETTGPRSRFGLNAESLEVSGVSARAWHAIIGSLRVTDLGLAFHLGEEGC